MTNYRPHTRSQKDQNFEVAVIDTPERAIVNHVLRMTGSAAHYTEIKRLPADWNVSKQQRWEKDHFIEVQHVVNCLFNEGHLTAANLRLKRLGEFEILSRYINRSENIFEIPRDINQKKKGISIDCYSPSENQDPLISSYLSCQVEVVVRETGYQYYHGTSTIQDVVQELADEMTRDNREDAYLAREVGKYIQSIFGWKSSVTSGIYGVPGTYGAWASTTSGGYKAPGTSVAPGTYENTEQEARNKLTSLMLEDGSSDDSGDEEYFGSNQHERDKARDQRGRRFDMKDTRMVDKKFDRKTQYGKSKARKGHRK